jgi:hypothetical protein
MAGIAPRQRIYTNCYYLTKDNVSYAIFDRDREILFPE